MENVVTITDFTLMTAGNVPITLSNFTDRYVFLYFGYTFCPDVCPATLSELAQVRRELGSMADRVQVIMITVDPDRDTPEVMQSYVNHFDPTFIGLSGSQAEIDAIGQTYGIYYEKHEGTAATGYLIDHTARVFLLSPDRNTLISYPFATPPADIVADLKWLLGN
ncbi:MAG: SCO family protein [Ardenticatenaceae bacterium]|nr:SCO family protein [Ardenticatenaceae bacterium]